MDFLLDPRVYVPAILAFIGFVGAWAKNSDRVSGVAKDVEIIRMKDLAAIASSVSALNGRIGAIELDVERLKSDRDHHASRLDELVSDLREVVKDLRSIAIKFAEGHGKA